MKLLRNQKGGAVLMLVVIFGIAVPATLLFSTISIRSLQKIKIKCDLDIKAIDLIEMRRRNLLGIVTSNIVLKNTKRAIYVLRGLSVSGAGAQVFTKIGEQVLLRLNHQAYLTQQILMQKDSAQVALKYRIPDRFTGSNCILIPNLSASLIREVTSFPDVRGGLHFPTNTKTLSAARCFSRDLKLNTRIDLDGDCQLQNKKFYEKYQE